MKSVGINLFSLVFLLLSFSLGAQTPYDVVKKDYKPEKKLVHDFGEIFSPNEREQLEKKLVAYDNSTSVQIVIVTFKKLEDYPLELLANEIGEKWGVGQKEKHNGIVIVFAKDDRKVTIRGGYGIQAKMPPTIEKLIIDREMIPSFRQENYYQGFDNAIQAIELQLAGQYEAMPKKDEEGVSGLTLILLVFGLLILFTIFAGGGGNGGGNRGRRRSSLDDVIISNTGRSTWGGSSWGGGGFGSGSGGGFGGFGGGSFGGGGASGSW